MIVHNETNKIYTSLLELIISVKPRNFLVSFKKYKAVGESTEGLKKLQLKVLVKKT